MIDVLETSLLETRVQVQGDGLRTDLEQQLHLAEERCGTLRGQVDYMKRLRSSNTPRTPRVRIMSPRLLTQDLIERRSLSADSLHSVHDDGLMNVHRHSRGPEFQGDPGAGVTKGAPNLEQLDFAWDPWRLGPLRAGFTTAGSPPLPKTVCVNPIAEILKSAEEDTTASFSGCFELGSCYPPKMEESGTSTLSAPDGLPRLSAAMTTTPVLPPNKPDEMSLRVSPWLREQSRPPSYALTSLLRQRVPAAPPHRRPQFADLAACPSASLWTMQSDSPKASPPDVDLSARLVSSFLREACQGLSQVDVEAPIPPPLLFSDHEIPAVLNFAALDEAAHRSHDVVHRDPQPPAAADLPPAVGPIGTTERSATPEPLGEFHPPATPRRQVASVRPLSPPSAPSPPPTDRTSDGPEQRTGNSVQRSPSGADDQEPWRQVLGLAHDLAEDVRRMASGQCGSPPSHTTAGRSAYDPSEDASSSGGSVYEDPLADTPRTPRTPHTTRALMGVELYSNTRFHAEDSVSSDESLGITDSETSPADLGLLGSVSELPRLPIETDLSQDDDASPRSTARPVDSPAPRPCWDREYGELSVRRNGDSIGEVPPTAVARPWTAGCESTDASVAREGRGLPPPPPPPSELTAPLQPCAPIPIKSVAPVSRTATPAQLSVSRHAPHYECATASSRLKRRPGGPMSVVPVAGPRTSSSGWSWSGPPPSAAAAAPNPRHRAFPFVAATSTSPSHNTQLCLQSVLSQRKMRRPSTSPSTGTYGPNNGAPFPRPSTPGVPLRSRPPTAVLTTPCPCPLLNADIGDTDSCGTGDSAGSSAGSVRLDQDEALDHQNDKLAKQSLQGRWATEASSKCQSSTAAARCQCYPRHVAEYDHVLKPFLRKAATGRDLRPAPSPRTPRVPRVTGKTGKPGKPKPPPLHRATTRAAKTASPEPSVRPKTPAVKVNNPPTPRAGCRFDVDELRSVVVSLRQDLVALGAARDAERKRGSRGRRLKELKELEDGLERKEAELRVIVDLYRQVQQLRSEMSKARRFDSTIEESSPALHS